MSSYGLGACAGHGGGCFLQDLLIWSTWLRVFGLILGVWYWSDRCLMVGDPMRMFLRTLCDVLPPCQSDFANTSACMFSAIRCCLPHAL